MLSAIRSKRAVTPEGVRPATIVFDDGLITAVKEYGAEIGTMSVFDVYDSYLLPGLIDTHIHVNEPGRTEWEGFATASRAAAAGGYTCLVDMPLNSIPATIDIPALALKRASAAGKSLVDYGFWGGAVAGNANQLFALARAGVHGFKCFMVDAGVPEFAYASESDLRTAMPLIAQTGLPLLVHAEDPAVIAAFTRPLTEDATRYATFLQSRPPAAELAAIERLIVLCREYRCRVHIVHLSTAAAIPALRRAREEGLPITVETCPHYLYFEASQISDGATQFKCAPPIRDEANREQLWQALREGVIDLIATDHSPCPPELKGLSEGDFLQAWGGIASVSLALSAIWTAARKRNFTIADVTRWMAENTARLAGLRSRKGRLAAGYDADFVVFDPEAVRTVEISDLYFRHPVSPYLGERMNGRVNMTFVRGRLVFDHGTLTSHCSGRECTVSEWSTAR